MQPHVRAFLDVVQHDGLNNGSLERPLRCIAVILHLGLLLLVLKDADLHLTSLLAHKRDIEGKIFVDVLLLAQVDEADPEELLHSVYLAPGLCYDPLHL